MEKPANLKSEYRKFIRACVNDQKRNGFVGYWGSMKASRGAEELLDNAESLAGERKYLEAIEIYQAIIETFVPAIQYADDSNGTIGDAINNAVEGLKKCSVFTTEEEKDNLFKYLVREADKKQYHDWDWEMDLLNIAAELTDDEIKTRILFDQLDRIGARENEETHPSEYTHETILKLKGIVLKKRSMIPEFKTFLREHINYSAIRELAIRDAIDNNQLEEAKVLANAGINIAEQKMQHGCKATWHKFLLEIAKKESNIEDIKKHSKVLFIDSGEMEYYEEIRRQYPVSEWPEKALELMKEMPERISVIQDIPGKIYVREENWDGLLSFAKQRASIYFLNRYHEHIIKHFPKELSVLYNQVLRKEIAAAHDRSGYRHFCRIILDMEECGVKEDVKDLIEWIRRTYPIRIALQDELRKVIKNRY